MFNPNTLLIDAFVEHATDQFTHVFPNANPEQVQALAQAAHTALETLLNCDCPYHDIQHTVLVAEAGQTILQGRQLSRGDLTPHLWLQAVVAMLFHDIGYLRNLLADDARDSSVIDPQGNRVTPPEGATDAYMTPHHVTRGIMYVRERFANEPAIDVGMVCEYIDMTRFPVPPNKPYQQTDNLAGLVRAADLIGQMADPQYLQKLPRLHAEFVETGNAARNGYTDARGMRQNFPQFFYADVQPYIGEGVAYLKRTQEGHLWLANLYHHLHLENPARDLDPRLRAPELVVDNARPR